MHLFSLFSKHAGPISPRVELKIIDGKIPSSSQGTEVLRMASLLPAPPIEFTAIVESWRKLLSSLRRRDNPTRMAQTD